MLHVHQSCTEIDQSQTNNTISNILTSCGGGEVGEVALSLTGLGGWEPSLMLPMDGRPRGVGYVMCSGIKQQHVNNNYHIILLLIRDSCTSWWI